MKLKVSMIGSLSNLSVPKSKSSILINPIHKVVRMDKVLEREELVSTPRFKRKRIKDLSKVSDDFAVDTYRTQKLVDSED